MVFRLGHVSENVDDAFKLIQTRKFLWCDRKSRNDFLSTVTKNQQLRPANQNISEKSHTSTVFVQLTLQ